MSNWSNYKSHNRILARVNHPCELFGLFIEALDKIDQLKARWPNGGRPLYCEQAFLKGIKARSLDLDIENDMNIR